MKFLKAGKIHEQYITGSVGSVVMSGGYLYIYLGDTLLHIASIPLPNLLGEMNRDTEVVNKDEFKDEKGNEFRISIFSSAAGIYWELETYPEDEKIVSQLRYEVKINEY